MSEQKKTRCLRTSLLLFAASVVIYTLLSYGGIRSPDSEIVFRTTESLATRSTFAVREGTPVWPGFGIAKGVDGREYSVFGPGQSVAAVPMYALAEWLVPEHSELSESSVGPSLYVRGGFDFSVKGVAPRDLRPHAVRTMVSYINVIVGALTVVVFFWLCLALTQSRAAALLTSVLFGFGTLFLAYTGTFFSEPLAMLFLTSSLYGLVRLEGGVKRPALILFLVGVSIGLSALTHISAMLLVPFITVYLFAVTARDPDAPHPWRDALRRVAIFCAGLGLMLLLLAWYNYARFGDVLETGRTAVDGALYGYGTTVNPLNNFWKLFVSAGKGLLFYCPLALLSLIVWKPFHRRHRLLSIMILSAFLGRVIFIASRSDWHAGWGLGPRFLVMALPLMVLPVAVFFKDVLEHRRLKQYIAATSVGLGCIVQQLYFAVGEVFSFYYIVLTVIRKVEQNRLSSGQNPFAHGLDFYLPWAFSPLLRNLDSRQGPLLLRPLGLSNTTLFWCLALVAVALFSVFCWRLWRLSLQSPPPGPARAQTSTALPQ